VIGLKPAGYRRAFTRLPLTVSSDIRRPHALAPIGRAAVTKTNGPSETLRPKLPGNAFRRSARSSHFLLGSKSGLIWKTEWPNSAGTAFATDPVGRALPGA